MPITQPAHARLNDLLHDLRISQRELARRLGWTQAKIYRRCAGLTELTVREAEQIAAALDVPISRLVSTDAERAA